MEDTVKLNYFVNKLIENASKSKIGENFYQVLSILCC